MYRVSLITAVISALVLTGCSTPQERAEARQRSYELKQQKIKKREDGYRDTCASYGYEVGTPQFNQCVATERRQYKAERKALAQQKALEKALKSNSKSSSSYSNLPMCMPGGGGIALLCND